MPLTESEKKAITKMLSEVPIFSHVKKKDLSDIVESASTRMFEPGETIVKEGDDGVCFYLIWDGNVQVRGKGKDLAKLGRGEFFGEMALLNKQPRTASVIAIDKTTCLLVTRWSFKSILSAHPKIALSVLEELSKRVTSSNKAFSE